MKKSFHIFQRDLSRLLHNKAAILVLIGVCLLPSLYAWFNIAANLDPYGNTQRTAFSFTKSFFITRRTSDPNCRESTAF